MTNRFPLLSLQQCRIVVGIPVALILMAHGVMQIYLGTVGGFGSFPASKGFPAGEVLAWVISSLELAAGLYMIANKQTRWVSAAIIIQLLTGIVLVYAQYGWFVVRAADGGMQYSVLLVLCLLHTMAVDQSNRRTTGATEFRIK